MINTSTNSSFPNQVVPEAEKRSWEYGLLVAQAIEHEWFRGGRINNRTKHDASISSGLALMACNKNKYRPNAQVIKEKVSLGFAKYNNDGNNSKIFKE